MYRAARNAHTPVVGIFLAAGAEVDKADKGGRTPLLEAAEHAHDAVVGRLLEAGADVNQTDKSRNSPLLLAAMYGSEAVVAQLLDAVADVNKADMSGRTPLYEAAILRKWTVVERLLKAGADVNKASHVGATASHVGATALHWVARGREVDLVKQLIEMGANVNQVDEWGRTPLDHAVAGFWDATNVDSVQEVKHALIEAGADVVGQGALHHAAKARNLELVNELLEMGYNVNKVNFEGETPLHEAVRGALNDAKCVVRLIAAGADVFINHRDDSGHTALDYAASEGLIDVVKALLEAGAYVSKKNYEKKQRDDPARKLLETKYEALNDLQKAAQAGDREAVSYCLFHSKIKISDGCFVGFEGKAETPLTFALQYSLFHSALGYLQYINPSEIVKFSPNGENMLMRLIQDNNKTSLKQTTFFDYAKYLVPDFMAQFDPYLEGKAPLTREQKLYLTSGQPDFFFRTPDFFDIDNRKKHLMLYYKVLLDTEGLKGCELFKPMAMYSAAHLRHVLKKEEDLSYLCAQYGIDTGAKAELDRALDDEARIHFQSKAKDKETPRVESNPNISMQKLHLLLKEEHPFYRGFCAGKLMEFARFFSDQSHQHLTVKQMMHKYFDKSHRADVAQTGVSISPVAVREAYYQHLYTLTSKTTRPIDWDTLTQKLGGSGSASKKPRTLTQSGGSVAEEPKIFPIHVFPDDSLIGHALLMGKKGNAYFFWDSNLNLEQNTAHIYEDESKCIKNFKEFLGSAYKACPDVNVSEITSETLAHLKQEKHPEHHAARIKAASEDFARPREGDAGVKRQEPARPASIVNEAPDASRAEDQRKGGGPRPARR